MKLYRANHPNVNEIGVYQPWYLVNLSVEIHVAPDLPITWSRTEKQGTPCPQNSNFV